MGRKGVFLSVHLIVFYSSISKSVIKKNLNEVKFPKSRLFC